MKDLIEQAALDVARQFRCAGCKQVVSWSKGCDDEMPEHCDDCWVVEQAAEICSAMASMYGATNDWLAWSEVYQSLGHRHGDAVQSLAWRVSVNVFRANVNYPMKPGTRWALASSMLRNGEVQP